MKNLFSLSLVFLLSNFIYSQTQAKESAFSGKPRLIVGIVVDQMRNDYIYRYWNRYGNGGFKRLVNEGFYFRNAHYNYIPTVTGPGHCSIYTGTTPRMHGIIANEWYNKASGETVYCVKDPMVNPVGTDNKKAQASPKNQLSSTIGDELRISSNKRSKVFSISHKDRSAILPGGHMANGAFWMDEKKGVFVSSTWYMAELPKWMQEFNNKNLAKNYLEKGWTTLYPIETYSNSISDENNYEELLTDSVKKPVFPYYFKTALAKNYYSGVYYTPYSNTLIKEAALGCVVNEQLGKDEDPDLLAISFSNPDAIGHMFGPRSVEEEDIYLRLDKELEDLLNRLDKEVGKNNYTVFLTADHGGADVPNHLLDNKIPAGYMNEKEIGREIKNYLQKLYGDSMLLYVGSEQVFLNNAKIASMKLDKEDVEQKLCNFLVTLNGIAEAYPSTVLKNSAFIQNDLKALLQNGYNHKLSGNICFVYQPAWMDHDQKGTTHGAGYNYDTHVPVLFYGAGIKKGESFDYITITQIAPTVCELLRINQPNATTAGPLNAFFK